MTIEEFREALYLLGHKVAEAVKYDDSDLQSPFFHDLLNCGAALQILEELVIGVKRTRVIRRGFCVLHQLQVCFCGWEYGKHYNECHERGAQSLEHLGRIRYTQ